MFTIRQSRQTLVGFDLLQLAASATVCFAASKLRVAVSSVAFATDVFLEQRQLTIVVFLRELQLGVRFSRHRRCLIDGRLELGDIGLRVRQPRSLLRDDVFVRLRDRS